MHVGWEFLKIHEKSIAQKIKFDLVLSNIQLKL